MFGKAACSYKEVLNNAFFIDTTTNLAERHHKKLNGFLGPQFKRKNLTFLTVFKATRRLYTVFYSKVDIKYEENFATVHEPDVLHQYEFV